MCAAAGVLGPLLLAGARHITVANRTLAKAQATEKTDFSELTASALIANGVATSAVALGPAGEIIRLAGDTGQKMIPQIRAALLERLEPLLTPEGVWAPSSAWLITARA